MMKKVGPDGCGQLAAILEFLKGTLRGRAVPRSSLPAEVIQIPAADFPSEHPQVEKQLVFVAGEVLVVDEEQGYQGLAIRHEDRRQLALEVRIAEQRESLMDGSAVRCKMKCRVGWVQRLIGRKLLQFEEVTQKLRVGRVEHGTEARKTLEHVSQENGNRESPWNLGRPIQLGDRDERNQVLQSFELIIKLGQEGSTDTSFHVER